MLLIKMSRLYELNQNFGQHHGKINGKGQGVMNFFMTTGRETFLGTKIKSYGAVKYSLF